MKVTATEKENRVSVTLELTVSEAQFLYDLCNRVGGDPKLSRRKYADSFMSELRNFGYDGSYTSLSPLSGSVFAGKYSTKNEG